MENKIIKFQIVGIRTEQFAIIQEAYKPNLGYMINHELSFGLDKPNQVVQVTKTAKFLHKESLPFLILSVSCLFKVDDESWAQLVDENSIPITLPRDFAIHLAMTTIGTLRGVLHAKTEYTPFATFIIPTVDASLLVPNPLIFS